MSELVTGTPAEEKYAKTAMKARGGTVLEAENFIPGDLLGISFLRRHGAAVDSLVPDGLGSHQGGLAERRHAPLLVLLVYHAMDKVGTASRSVLRAQPQGRRRRLRLGRDQCRRLRRGRASNVLGRQERQAEVFCFDETSIHHVVHGGGS